MDASRRGPADFSDKKTLEEELKQLVESEVLDAFEMKKQEVVMYHPYGNIRLTRSRVRRFIEVIKPFLRQMRKFEEDGLLPPDPRCGS